MEQSITTAVIAVAGWGTRWLPLTKSIEKCMLPVGTRPVVDWAVADCVQAGVKRVIFVVGEESDQIRQYYSHHAELNEYLTQKGKTTALQQVQQPQYAGVTFEFMAQPKERYGTAVPIAIVAPALPAEEHYLYLMGDDLIYRQDGGNEVADLCQAWTESNAEGALMTKEVAREDVSKYGVVMTDEQGNFVEIKEKPPLEEIADVAHPSCNLGKYVMSPELTRLTLEYMTKPSPNKDGEYYITDIFGNAAAAGRTIKVHYVKGEHLDAGTPKNWLATNQRVMGD